ncbi:MBL fold metallo-hydrolase [Dyella soli]|nr:MBL fold metallo-hydrolase [Dyella soli]
MKLALSLLLAIGWLLAAPALAQLAPGSMDVQWDRGATDCDAHPPRPLQVHRYNERTYILRESLCQTYEGPFVYLLIGTKRALLIDTGDVADARKMPLASTVVALLPQVGASRMPLLVVHTHSHLDHRGGDAQFASLPDVSIVGTGLAQVVSGFGFRHWPDDVAQIDLGDRIVDVIPTQGHTDSHVSFYDRVNGLAFTGDFFLPGRLVIGDAAASRASAGRMAAFLHDLPVSHVLGGHIELDRQGNTEPMGASFHPDERPLQLGKDELMTLPAVLAGFNGFYGRSGVFVMYSQTRMLQLVGATGVLLLIVIALGIRSLLRRRRRQRALLAGEA